MISSPSGLNIRPKMIKSIKFGIMSPEIVRKISVMEVKNYEVYDSSKLPVSGGLMDPRLGVLEPGAVCKTCGKRGGQCPGHFGHIELAYPVYHIGFVDTIRNVARATCEHCGRSLLTEEEKESFRKKIEQSKWDRKMYKRVLRMVIQKSLSKRKDLRIIYEIGRVLWKGDEDINNTFHYRLSLMDVGLIHTAKDMIQGAESLKSIMDALEDEDVINLLKIFDKFGINDIEVVSEVLDFLIKANKTGNAMEDIISYFINNMHRTNKLDIFRGRVSISGIDPIEAKNVYDEEIKLIENFVNILEKLSKAAKNSEYAEILRAQYEEVREIIESIGGPEEAYKNGIYVDKIGELHVPSSLAKTAKNYSRVESARCPHCGMPLSLDVEYEKITKYYRWELIDTRLNDIASKILGESESPISASTLVEKVISKVKSEKTYNRHRIMPDVMRDLFERIPDDELFLYDLDPEASRPEWMIITVLPVPPVTVRPTITLESGERSEDDLTHKLVDIIKTNNKLLEHRNSGAPQIVIGDLWDLLQYHITTYFNNRIPGVPSARHRGTSKAIKSLTERLSGKEGRFRGSLAGKRVNFSARTVISPDPSLSINEVGVPYEVAMELTVPVVVTEYNIEELRKLVRNGPHKYPGANSVYRPDARGRLIRLVITPNNKERLAQELQPGWVVERHLIDGDIVLFNRQPSLHRMSIMGHIVRVLPYKTFRLNLPVCTPYNADFDGDEMNLHVLQGEEARAEAEILMKVQEHILSPRFGGPIIGGIHDHISGLFILTHGERLFSKDEVSRILSAIKYEGDLPPPDKIIDGKEYWSGKTIFSLILPKDLNLLFDATIGSKLEKVEDKMKEDAIVEIRNGRLVRGSIDEAGIGAFKGIIIDAVVRKYGTDFAHKFIDKIAALGVVVDTIYGFTTGIADVDVPEEAKLKVKERIEEARRKIADYIDKYKKGLLEAEVGRTIRDTLESKIMEELSKAREDIGRIVERHLGLKSNAVLMARSGARAKMLDLTMTAGSLGQQTIRGSRINRGFQGRTTAHFKRGDLGLEPHGFVASSYKDGLNPIEYFFHSAGGREGLVDTAVRTSRSGYMQRRLVNALDSVYVAYDGTVRDGEGRVIQFVYGDDGVDPSRSAGGRTVDLKRIIEEVKAEKASR